MLVLTRKTQQQIQIGPNITITILQVKGQAVRVGIDAPKDVCVLRTELAERMSPEERNETVEAAVVKARREEGRAAINPGEAAQPIVRSGLEMRCRAPRVESATLTSILERKGPASPVAMGLKPRSRRLLMQ